MRPNGANSRPLAGKLAKMLLNGLGSAWYFRNLDAV